MEDEDFDIRIERSINIIRISIKKTILKKFIFIGSLIFFLLIFLINFINNDIWYHLNSIFFVLLGNFIFHNIIMP